MKQAIRKELLRRRNSFSPEEILAGSRIIADQLAMQKDYQKAEIVMFYASCGSEVSTDDMIETALKNNRLVAVPLVHPEDRTMRAVLIRDPDRDLFPGFKGIREPDPGSLRELAAVDLDLIIVPGVAFDSAGNRVGMGKGYYDRFLKHLRRSALKIALAFENQIVASIPCDDNDIKMDMIITEERVIYCS